jgi:hypothetical protein
MPENNWKISRFFLPRSEKPGFTLSPSGQSRESRGIGLPGRGICRAGLLAALSIIVSRAVGQYKRLLRRYPLIECPCSASSKPKTRKSPASPCCTAAWSFDWTVMGAAACARIGTVATARVAKRSRATKRQDHPERGTLSAGEGAWLRGCLEIQDLPASTPHPPPPTKPRVIACHPTVP